MMFIFFNFILLILLSHYILINDAFITNKLGRRSKFATASVVLGSREVSASRTTLRADLDDNEMGEIDGFKSSFVSILGNPNVGKSTLLNALLGEELCIVSPKPQTTRHRILGILTDDKRGYQIVFSDTPGMLKPAYALQETMATSIKGAVGDGDIIIIVTDVYGEPLVDEQIFSKIAASKNQIIVAINKVDLVKNDESCTNQRFDHVVSSEGPEPSSKVDTVLKSRPESVFSKLRRGKKARVRPSATATSATEKQRELEESSSGLDKDHIAFIRAASVDENKSYRRSDEKLVPQDIDSLVALWQGRLPRASCVVLSAAHGWGIDNLVALLIEMSPPGPKYFPSDTLTTRDERFFASEIIRECLLNQYKDEIPYSSEVRIDNFRDKSDKLSVIEATIVVSRDSQKGIVIGNQGAALKQLGISARKRLEEFLDRGVFLDLRVKVVKDWRESKDSLAAYGYTEDIR